MPVVKPQLVQATTDRPAEAIARDLEQVLEQIGEAVIVKDLNAVVTYWNREAASLYGFSAAEAVGQPLHRLHAADLSEADYTQVLERIRSGRPSSKVPLALLGGVLAMAALAALVPGTAGTCET